MSKISLDEIKFDLTRYGWTLVSDSYQNLDSELVYECPEGHRVYGPWKTFRNKKECPQCRKNALVQVQGEIQTKGKDVKRILALDQATRVTGWSIFDNGKLVTYGKFETDLEDEIARCHAVKEWLLSMIRNWRPDKIGLEGIQFQVYSNGKHSMGVPVFETLAHLQGILMEVCFEEKIPYEVCPTNTWRAYCGVRGQARTDKKRSMQMLVKQWYDVSVTDDESDAIGLGKYFAEHYMKNVIIENWE